MQPSSNSDGSGGISGQGLLTAGAQAFSTLGAGIAQSRAASFNAAVAAQNATLAQQAGASQEAASDASYRGAEGNQIAAIGGSGLMMGTGSTLQAVAQSRVMQTMSAMQISREAQIKAMGYGEQASMDSATARNDIIGGITGATSGVLNTRVDYANQWNAGGYGGSPGAGALQPASVGAPVSSGSTGGYSPPGWGD